MWLTCDDVMFIVLIFIWCDDLCFADSSSNPLVSTIQLHFNPIHSTNLSINKLTTAATPYQEVILGEKQGITLTVLSTSTASAEAIILMCVPPGVAIHVWQGTWGVLGSYSKIKRDYVKLDGYLEWLESTRGSLAAYFHLVEIIFNNGEDHATINGDNKHKH